MKNQLSTFLSIKSGLISLFLMGLSHAGYSQVTVELNQPTSITSDGNSVSPSIVHFDGHIEKEADGSQKMHLELTVRLERDGEVGIFEFDPMVLDVTQYTSNSYTITPWRRVNTTMTGSQNRSNVEWSISGVISETGRSQIDIGLIPRFSTQLVGSYTMQISPTYLFYRTLRLLGDVNHDCIVDGADAGILFQEWGRFGHSDFNLDGIVNGEDYLIMQAHFGDRCH